MSHHYNFEDTAETVQMEADKKGLGKVPAYQVTVGPPGDLVVVALFYGPNRLMNTIMVRMDRPWSKWLLRRTKRQLQRKADNLNHQKASLIAQGGTLWEGFLVEPPVVYESRKGKWA